LTFPADLPSSLPHIFPFRSFERLWRYDYIYNSTKPLTSQGTSSSFPPRFTFSTDLFSPSTAWSRIKSNILPALNRNKAERLRRQRVELQRGRQTLLKPLHAQLVAAALPAERKVFPTHTSFLYLPTVEALWKPDDAVINPSRWSVELKEQIGEEVDEKVMETKLRLFDKVARTLWKEGFSLHLPLEARRALLDNSDNEPVSPALCNLDDNLVDSILARPTALFECPCNERRPYPDVVEHVAEHHPTVGNVEWAFSLASEKFRKAVREMLRGVGRTEEDTTVEELRAMGKCFGVVQEKTVWTADLRTEKVEEEEKGFTWEEIVRPVSSSPFPSS
jgi:hypothetical protein